MHLSREAGWYDVAGNAVYVRANEKYADSDPAVRALPTIFDKISDDAPPVRAAVKAAVSAARGRAAAAAAGGGGGTPASTAPASAAPSGGGKDG